MPDSIVVSTASVNGNKVERIKLEDVVFTELQLVKLESGAMVEEELPFTCSSYEYLELIYFKKITLEDFIKKATDRYNKRKKVVDIEVEGFGALTFKRPSDSDLLEFKNTLANSIKFSKDESIDKLNYGQMLTRLKN
ncbi:phage tail tube protein [Clostridium sporogenes]|uniref:phage tail tube protein n=1 Tax=Clostridium sporogenes TaxID=1509 RepID=UPI001FA8EA8E|nr:phage tail tube protein [Clostridium sporogenes]